MLDVLRHRTFRRLFTAQIVALIGTGLLTVALGLLAYDLAGSDAGAVLGTALAIKMLAYVGVAPIISALTHRVPRKVLLVSADVIRALIALALPFVDQTWQIYVLIFLLQSASATFTPAFQSVIPSVLVEEEDYTRALSLSRLAYDLESLLSPILAAALLTLISYHSLFLGTVVGFTVSGLLVVGTTLPKLAPAGPAVPLVQRITLGARVMVGSPVLRGLLALNLVVASATGLVVVNTVVYVRDLLGGTNTGVALALGFYGGGSMLVALCVPRILASISTRRLMLTGSAVVALGLAAASSMLLIAPTPPISWVMLTTIWIALGAGTSMINTPSARLLRDGSTPENRGTVFTAQFSLSHAGFLLTYPLAGWGRSGGQSVHRRGRIDRARYTRSSLRITGLARECRPDSRGGRNGKVSTPMSDAAVPAVTDVRTEASLVHPIAPDQSRLDAATGTFRMLADPTRLHILWLLTQGEADVTALTEACDASRTAVSQHLAKLRFTGLVDTPQRRTAGDLPNPRRTPRPLGRRRPQPRRPPGHGRTRTRIGHNPAAARSRRSHGE